MSKLITDYTPLQCCPRTKWCAVLATCLLTQIFSFAAQANAFEDFDLLGSETPACEDCAENNNAPAFEHTRVAMNDTHGQTQPMVESEFPIEAPISYDSTGYEQAEFAQNYDGQIDYGQGFQYGQTEYEQGYNSGVEQVSYDSQFSSQDDGQNYGQEIVGSQYPQYYGDTTVQQYPAAQTYASYQEMPAVSRHQSSAQTYTSSASSSGNVQSGLAQQKAVQAAQSGVKGHLGGGLGGAKYEGVGWSNHSPQNAIHSCCYWGVRPTAQIGVSKGNDGFWYACVLYH